ncbi:MAG: hypothetical protein DME21_05600 [Verrucomicrobia bacterium]|nr:MAG: hypothetical protein DME21_05600 [Verrucomicrobiota bacterium]
MNVEAGDTGDYQLVVYYEAYWMASTVAHLTFVGLDQAPVITIQPESQTVGENSSATLSVTATGDNLVYQWAFNGHSIPDGTNASYALTNAGSGNAGSYEVFVSNPAGFVASTLASLTVVGASRAPVITVQPVSQTVTENSSATFSVTAEGDHLAYQWWFNGYPLPDGTNAACTLMNAGGDNAGDYQVVVSNEAGWAAGARVTLTVVDAGQTPPTLSAIQRQLIDKNTSTKPLSFTIDGGVSDGVLNLSASSSDTNLIPNENILLDGAGTNRTVTIRPATDQSGTCDITLAVTDSAGLAASSVFTLTVNDGNQPPEFVGNAPIIAQPYQLYSYAVNVTDPNPDDSLQVTALVLPPWLSFDPVTRLLSGTPRRGGPEGDEVVLQASDGIAPPATKEFRIWTANSIEVTNVNDVELKRQALIQYIWGAEGWPTNRTPTDIQTNISDSVYSGLYNEQGNLARIDLYTFRLDYGIKSRVYHFHPIRGNGRLFIYHAGHEPGGGFEHEDAFNGSGMPPGLVIPELLKAGYSVLAFSMPVYNEYGPPRVAVPGAGIGVLDSHDAMIYYLDRPFRFFFEPIISAVNYAEDTYAYKSVYMTGLSGGGWTTTVYAALDPRIERSYPVAGSVPNYLRVGCEGLGDAEQNDPGLYRIANFEELYAMGACGTNRLQFQILNLYDSCCFYGPRYTNWTETVKAKVTQIGSGAYDFFSDDTHSDHKISTTALSVILDSLPLTSIQPPTFTRTSSLVFSAVCDNTNLITDLTIDYTSPKPTGSLNFNIASDASGVANITVTLRSLESIHSSVTRSFKITVLPPNLPPTVQWASPTNDLVLESSQPVPLAVNASDPDGSIILVRFLDGTNCIGTLTNGDLAITWDDISPGTHVLSVVATDDRGASVATQPITITLQAPNLLPAVEWLAPEGGTILQSPQAIVLQVNASDPDGRVAQVEYFVGPDSVGIATNDPFQLTWAPQTKGTYELRAVATDDRGSQVATDTMTLTVLPPNQLPVVQILNPTNGFTVTTTQAVTLEATATDSDGTIVQVEFRDGTNSLGVVSNPPYSLLWTNATVGTHSLSAVATDDRGAASTSDSIDITVASAPTNEVALFIRSAELVEDQTSPSDTSTGDTPNRQFVLHLEGPDGNATVIEASTDLKNWVSISTNTLMNGAAAGVDPQAKSFNLRFYRARLATQTP